MKKAGSRMSKRVALKSNISRRDFICSGALAAAQTPVLPRQADVHHAVPVRSRQVVPKFRDGTEQ